MGQNGEQGGKWGGGRAQILSGLSGCHQPCSEQGLQRLHVPPHSSPHWAHTQSGHALFKRCHLLCAAHQEPLHGPSFPKSPLLSFLNKQDGSLRQCCKRAQSSNRGAGHLLQKDFVLRDTSNVIHPNSRLPACMHRTFQEEAEGGGVLECWSKRICDDFFRLL